MVLNTWEKYLAQERENPFFTFVSFQSPHGPSLPPKEFTEPFLGDILLPDPPKEDMLQHPIWHKSARIVDDAWRQEWLRYYYAFVHYTDWCVGEALRLLDESGQRDNTLVIYLSDHGDMGFNHGLSGKTQFYEESVRVPLVMHKPDTISAGQHHTGLVELIDLFPTFCEVAGTEPPALSGRSLWSDICTQNYHGKDAVYSESYPMERNVDVFGPRPHRMVLTNEWKLIQYGDICIDLYDVQKDPDNHHDLANDSEYSETVDKLLGQLNGRLGPLPTEDVWR
jgi:arylsulfatase A-like enzyme